MVLRPVQRRVYPSPTDSTLLIFTEIERPKANNNSFTLSIKSDDYAETVKLPAAFALALEKALKNIANGLGK